jgi:choloylglycine hydrolase
MNTTNKISIFFVLFFLALGCRIESNACTRVVYKGPNNKIITGRSMDFSIEIPANQWIFPRGVKRSGEVGKNSIEWVSKYGSIGISTWDIAIADGMNEKGLVANLLWLVESEYQSFNKEGGKKGMAISLWAQYVLDNFATVAEAVDELSKESFAIVSDFIPGTDKFTTVHLSISDATGDNVIFEYIKGSQLNVFQIYPLHVGVLLLIKKTWYITLKQHLHQILFGLTLKKLISVKKQV